MAGKGRAEAKDHVPKLAKEQHVKSIRLWFTDILRFLKSFAITPEQGDERYVLKRNLKKAAEIISYGITVKVM